MGLIGSRNASFLPRPRSMQPIPRTISPRFRTSGCGTGVRLQDTLRQVQEIRTYYDFPDIDIDRYDLDGTTREVMLAARELNVDKLPVSSRNWINEKLIYTHGYGVTMNPVNGFTAGRLANTVAKQHARPEHGTRSQRNPPRDLFWRTDQHRCVRQDEAAGVRLSARPKQ